LELAIGDCSTNVVGTIVRVGSTVGDTVCEEVSVTVGFGSSICWTIGDEHPTAIAMIASRKIFIIGLYYCRTQSECKVSSQ
jgi:hypothetical protein